MRSWLEKKIVTIRSPNSTRPWQHVLDVLNGYLILAFNLNRNNSKFHGSAFNFGPNPKRNFKVIEILRIIKTSWEEIKWNIRLEKKFKENKLLNLNSAKSNKELKWRPLLSTKQTVLLTVQWYKRYSTNRKEIFEKTLEQINFFKDLLKK